jgi:hypothetical protein
VDVTESARKHQDEDRFTDDDIANTVEHALYAAEDGEDHDLVLYLGPDRAGRLLEVVTVAREDGSEIAIHAMKMRAKYEQLLPQQEMPND